MMTKMLVKKPEPTLGRTNKPVQNKPDVKKKNVRITDHNILMTILLNDPDALTTEEFLFLQSVVGFRQASLAREEGRRRKRLRKMGLPHEKELPMQVKVQDERSTASNTGLPDKLQTGLEDLSGVSLSDVQVHYNSDKPQQEGALAYTQGSEIYIGPGQGKYLPHEGWHAVQQKQGRVSAAFQLKSGLDVNADEHLEKEADIMGKKAESNAEDSILHIEQTNGAKAPGTKGTVIQRVTLEEGMSLNSTKKQETAEKAEIIPAAYGETSENVKKIQQVLMSMNYWTGRSGDKASGYFGDVTRESLINFQTGYMKLGKQELYDKKGKYVGCEPGTAKSLNSAYKLLNNSNVPEQAKNGIMGMGKIKENNSTYNWDIKAGVYNAYVKEAQLILMNIGYKLPKYGADGKWSNSGETYEALLGFQKGCETKLGGVKKNGTAENRNEVEHFQGIGPTGKLDQRTYAALQKEQIKKVTANYNTTPKKVENGNKGTGNAIDLSKLKPEDVTREIAEWLIANPVNVFATQHPYITQAITGVDVLDLFYAGGFVMDGDGVYHARQEWSLQSFEYSGYNDFYDTVFHYATSMEKDPFKFSYNDKDYVLWAWKGDYLNLGAGAEMGIYTRMEVLGEQTKHWLVDQSLAMPMTLTLDYNGEQIISYDPKKVDPKIFDPLRKSTDKWWVTGFNPDYQDVKASELIPTYTVNFSKNKDMFKAFYNTWNGVEDAYGNKWNFDTENNTASLTFKGGQVSK